MSNYEMQLKLFQTMRLHPWIPEHKIWIEQEIAKLAVVDKTAADTFRADYDKKLAEYKTLNPDPQEQVEVKEEVKVEPKKRRRSISHS